MKELCARKTFSGRKNRQKIKDTITHSLEFYVKRRREAQAEHGNDSTITITTDDNNNALDQHFEVKQRTTRWTQVSTTFSDHILL